MAGKWCGEFSAYLFCPALPGNIIKPCNSHYSPPFNDQNVELCWFIAMLWDIFNKLLSCTIAGEGDPLQNQTTLVNR